MHGGEVPLSGPQVFNDPSGRRWRIVRRIAAALAVAVAVATTLFVVSLLATPWLPAIPGLSGAASRPAVHLLQRPPDRKELAARFVLHREREELWRDLEREREATHARQAARGNRARLPPVPPPRVVAAFFSGSQETGLNSLRAHAGNLTHLMPDWLHLDATGIGLDTSDFDPARSPHNPDVMKVAREHDVRVDPILDNAGGGKFDPDRAHRLLASPEAQQQLAVRLRDWLLAQDMDGLNLDLENLQPEDRARLPAFVQRLHEILRDAGLGLNADVEADREPAHLKAMADACDFVILMAYDQHWEGGEPGPIAAAGWFWDTIEHALKAIPPGKLVVGIGNYAYDWTQGVTMAEPLSYQQALFTARDNDPETATEKLVGFDADALNATFTYQDEKGRSHQVWMLDAASAWNEWTLAQRLGLRGSALWVLGHEDPGVWTFLDRHGSEVPPPAAALSVVRVPYDVQFDGDGELLAVGATPKEGRRALEVDPQTGLITDQTYLELPSSYVIRRSGFVKGAVALTFDDGPDPQWTPLMLDALKDVDAPGTFFVLGEEAERNPDLLRRMWKEGHEVGNHTFSHPNLAAVGHDRAALELNTAQRAIESILGRSTILFRPPYNADAEPVSAEEVAPVLLASELGYVTVGERIDPQDWNLLRPGPGGQRGPPTAVDLADDIEKSLAAGGVNVVLLHDGGGDRSRTVEAVRLVVPRLKAKGFRFVPVSALAGLDRDAVMPAQPDRERLLTGADVVIFEAVFLFEAFLAFTFALAIALGIGRVAMMVPLALVGAARARRRRFDPSFQPSVSVLIAAFNEEKVIARTIRSVLANDWPGLEVLVVDDGSGDGTSEAVAREFGDDPRVRCVRQDNAGKSAALNFAMTLATGEIQVCIDADTQVSDDCVAKLVRHFDDRRVAAVAGNVKVGNVGNLLTHWQAIEYVTSQNLDRRAYTVLNCITVVPGAIGAWRRKAVLDVGGYRTDTLAEDMDLTWRLRRAGWVARTEHGALAFTEAPDTLGAFAKQRFRWTYGTLQCLWKHKDALFRYGWFGTLALPTLWVFQVFFQFVAPVVDLQMLWVVGNFLRSWLARGFFSGEWQPVAHSMASLHQAAFFYALFFAVDLAASTLAFLLDRERLAPLWRLFWQRFVYRQVMYAVLWRSLVAAVRGVRAGWGKLERKGTVQKG